MSKRLVRIIIAAVLFVAGLIAGEESGWIRIALFVAGYIVIGWDVLMRGVKGLASRSPMDENLLMTVATLGAFAIGSYAEAVAVMLFYQVGEFFQGYAVDKSRRSIAELMDIRPDFANVRRDGKIIKIDPDEVAVGDIIVVKPGERVPLDGVVTRGRSSLDTSALTGESMPREIEIENEVISGCININGLIEARVTKEYGESTVAKILDLVENASSRKSNSEQFITKFARYYTPVVIGLALVLAVIPPLVIPGAMFSDWIYRALTFLVVSCPCALVVSIPLSFFGGIGGASRAGILVKGSNYLETLAKAETAVFDKTGTLTKGIFKVQRVIPAGNIDRGELLEVAAYAESYSSHPISTSLKEAYGRSIDESRVSDIEEVGGHGVSASFDGKRVIVGNGKLMEREGITYEATDELGTLVYVVVDGRFAGCIVIADELKPDSARAISQLKKLGVSRIAMFTGDTKRTGENVAHQLGIDEVYTELLPQDKVDEVEKLLREQSPKGKLIFVGDGINDAPVLARADIGLAMGGLGSDAAIEAADVVIMTDEPSKIPTAIGIAKKTVRIATENTVFAIGIKLVVLILAALGLASMWAAVFADVGVTFLAVLNSLRALRTEKSDRVDHSTAVKARKRVEGQGY